MSKKSNEENIKNKEAVKDINTDTIGKRSVFGTIVLILLIIVTVGFYSREFYLRLKAHNRIIKQNLVDEGEGLHLDITTISLYQDEPFASQYYFKGENVNNYLIYSDNCWQIVNIANNDAIKLMYLGPTSDKSCATVKLTSEKLAWNDSNNNDWQQSSLKDTLDTWVKENKIFNNSIDFSSEQSIIENATWFTGSVKVANYDTRKAIIDEHADIDTEEKTEIRSKIGLLNLTDYLKSSTSCSYSGAYFFDSLCGEQNYLYKNENYWLLNKTYGDDFHVWTVDSGGVQSKKTNNNDYLVIPVVYLKPNTLIKGKGTINKPYVVMDSIYDIFNIWD